ncbi:thioredoxin domain-containing protein [Quadrisphaera sp. INWT6]|uniref:DsbA family protein n=1 Tax=Quadrisphaera sp. INWT6 TaxID=2596917 RepID=UPI001892113C|nr:thioredoxin domain-containing protein [Quadrisphaera sp. INWT6]MBF5082999.1 thioredoxin domain-containing protein [Quadrisphaera sp. INWT6]
MPDRPSTKDARREAAREKSRQMRELEARKKRRNRVLAISAGVVAVVLVIGFVALAITRSGGSADASATPPGVTADGGIEVGQASAPHTVTIFQDYQCPVCKQYEAAVGPWLDEQVQAGTVKLDYRPLNFLDQRLRQDYSTRAANAAYCVAGEVPNGADFYKFNTAMYLEQPEEGPAASPTAGSSPSRSRRAPTSAPASPAGRTRTSCSRRTTPRSTSRTPPAPGRSVARPPCSSTGSCSPALTARPSTPPRRTSSPPPSA